MISHNYVTVSQLRKKSFFTIHQLKNWTKARKKNGLDGGIVKCGRRIYIDKDYFDKWASVNKKKISPHKTRTLQKLPRKSPKGRNHATTRLHEVGPIKNAPGFFARVLKKIFC